MSVQGGRASDGNEKGHEWSEQSLYISRNLVSRRGENLVNEKKLTCESDIMVTLREAGRRISELLDNSG